METMPADPRLDEFRSYGLPAEGRNPTFDALLQVAARLFNAPFAAVTFVDSTTAWVVSRVGNLPDSIPRDGSLCDLVVSSGEPVILPDAAGDPRSCRKPLVCAAPHVRFYAGVPVRSPRGHALGTLCVLDLRPRTADEAEVRALEALAQQIAATLEMRRRSLRLADREERLRALLDAEPECIKVVSEDGVILEMNGAGLEMLEADSPAQVTGRPITDFIDPGDRAATMESFRRILAGESLVVEFGMRGLRGTHRRMESHTKLLEGSPRRVLVVSRDVTEQRRLEADLLKARPMEALGRLAGGVAHDFNNFLAVMAGYVGLLTEAEAGRGLEEQARVRGLSQAIEQASGLSRQLLDFCRGGGARMKQEDLGEIVLRFEWLVRRLLRRDVRLEFAPPEGPLPVLADAGQVGQVLMNLALNAQEAMPRGGAIRIELRQADATESARAGAPHAVLSVADDGSGMTPAVRDRIFEPLFTTKSEGRGTGLGLAVVRDIVRRHGGHIDVESEPGRGSRFRIFLPQTEAAAPRRARRILAVEDNRAVRTLIRQILSAQGFEVEEAGGIQEALGRLHAGAAPDLLLADLHLADGEGDDLAREARTLRPGLKVLFLSGDAAGTVEDPFLPKPFRPDQLVAKVREALGR